MLTVSPVVKRVFRMLNRILIVFALVLIIGFLWGVTPLPRPPKGVRISPLNPPLPLDELRPDNAAYYYFKACDRMAGYHQSNESYSQMEAFLDGHPSSDTTALEAGST
jgi:hypothetical protein